MLCLPWWVVLLALLLGALLSLVAVISLTLLGRLFDRVGLPRRHPPGSQN